ncbi:MAG TPA: DUF4082 domain-containing protein [Verrucomicrobiae bacterium]|nr:DUF4082 domain-containing protein [Verrucomicrobiae bacterium]
MRTCCLIAVIMGVTLALPFNSLADPPFVYNVENTGTNFTVTNLPTLSNLPLVQPLPDPFMWLSSYTNGTFNSRSTNFVDWEQHRNEIAALIQNYEIGTKPTVNPSQITASYTNGTLTVKVTVGTNTLTLTCPVTLPSGSGPFPVCIGMDSPYGSLPSSMFTGRNIAGITYSESQVSTYGNPQTSNPYYKLYPNLNPSNTGQYSAWAWGVSRVIDGLYKLNGALGTNQIDLNHIAVTGCSYAGKLALFSGAFDERIALTIAQESGGGGANSWRYNHTQPSGSVEDIDNTDYNWFEDSMTQFSGNTVSYLPDDHHELDAMVAPRALYVTGNTDYTWLGNPSCYVCSKAAQQIFNTLGIPDRFGFNVDGGHSHCAFPNDQTNDLAYFLNKFMSGNTNLSSVVATYPGSYAGITYGRWTAWWGTGNPVFPNSVLSLTIPATATEGDGTLVGQGIVGVTPTPTNDLTVTLTSGNTGKVTVPATVVIPGGQSNAVFDLTIIDNSILDGDQTATITANSPICNNAPQATITVHDNETTTLSVALPASAPKSAGTLTNAGSVSMGAAAGANVTVSLSSSDTSKLIVPPTTVISTGQTSAVFNLTLVDDAIIDGPQNVTVTAHVTNWTDGSNTMTIIDDNPLPDHFAWSAIPSPQLIGEPFGVTITAQDAANNILDYRLPATLSAMIPGNAPGTNTILGSPTAEESIPDDPDEYTFGYSFTPSTNLKVTDVLSYFGDKVSIWTATGQLLASQSVVSVPGTWVDTPLPAPVVLGAGTTYMIATHENGLEYFWSDDLPTTFSGGTINQSYYDGGDVFPTSTSPARWFLVDLRYATDFVAVPVNPGATTNFSSGTWSGNLAVLQAGSNVILQASIPGHSGTSLPFNVLNAPGAGITVSGGSVVISWPVTPAGFILQETHDLSPGSTWTTVPGSDSPTVVGGFNIITNTPGGTNTFYRLWKP